MVDVGAEIALNYYKFYYIYVLAYFFLSLSYISLLVHIT